MRFYIFIVFFLASFNSYAQENNEIQASIRPLQSIMYNLTKGVSDVSLIMDQNESLHNYYLRPSKTRMIHNSETIVLVNRDFETFLSNVISTLDPKRHNIIEVSKFPGIELIEDVGGHHHGEHGHNHIGPYDYHIWLDPIRVKVIAKAIAGILITKDNANSALYKKNLDGFLVRLDELNENIEFKMKQIQNRQFIVTHNAYQYFIDRYKLLEPRAITIDHDHNIPIKEFLAIQDDIKTNKVQCIFEEPQFESKLIEKIKADTKVKIAKLDGEWGPDDVSTENQYFEMMNNLADSLYNCLK
jgi:zinc transport system substrate-binding protein